jgi:hypothetical protein
MKVVALFRFYLPYLLPRSGDWFEEGHAHLSFNISSHRVIVHPRDPNEPLFVDAIDHELSNQIVKIPPSEIPLKDVPTAYVIRDHCFDRLDAVVFGEIVSADEVLKEELRRDYLFFGQHACNQFLSSCRILLRDPDIKGMEWHFNFTNRTYYQMTPYTMIWCREENGEAIERLRDSKGELLEGASSGAIKSPKRSAVSLQSVLQHLSQGGSQDLPLGLVIQAQELIAIDRLQEGIIDLGSALEIASKQYLNRKGKESNPQVVSIAGKKGSFAEKRFHLLTSLIDNRSLKTEDPETFDLVGKIYRTRNKLAHEGYLGYQERRAIVPVDYILAHRFWAATERAVDWLASL